MLWYLLALIPFAIGVLIVVRSVYRLIDSTEHMPRVVVPGKGEIQLDPGDYIVYGETRSLYRGELYMATSLKLRCAMADASGGAIELTAPRGSSTYEMGSFSGQSMFHLTIPHAGVYRLSCEGEGGPTTIAFGRGGIGEIVVIILGMMGALFGPGVTVLVVYLLRRRSRRARASGTAFQTDCPG